MFLTDCQVSNKKCDILRSACEMSQQLAVWLAIHQASRSKQMINTFHGFGMAPEYNKILRVETNQEKRHKMYGGQ